MERIPKFRRVWKWLVVAGFLTGLFVSGGCGGSAPVSAEMPVPKVTTTAVVAQETIDMDEYTGARRRPSRSKCDRECLVF